MKRTLTLMAGALTLAAGLAASPHFAHSQAVSSWPTFHGGPNRDGVLNVSGPTTSQELARIPLLGTVDASPVVDGNGRAYIGDVEGTVYEFDPTVSNQVPVWMYQTKGAIRASPGLSPDGKTVYAASEDGHVYALDTSPPAPKTTSPAVRWTVDLGGAIRSSPVVSPDGSTVYVATITGAISALNAASGAVTWTKQTGHTIPASITLDREGTTIYFAVGDSGFVFSTPASSQVAWTPYYLHEHALSSPAVDANGNIYVTTTAGELVSFTPGTSAPRWVRNAPEFTQYISTPAISNGLVVVGNANGRVYGYNTDGTQQWQPLTGGPVYSSAAIASGNNQIYIGSSDGKIYDFSPQGNVTWSRSIGASVKTSPALAPDGTLWAVSDEGTLYHFGTPVIPSTPAMVATSTPGPTSTPGAPTATSVPVPPTPTATAAVVPLTISLKGQVKDGQKQTITITSAPNTSVAIRVDYPNGDHQSKKVTSNASGAATYAYAQGSSKITHSHFTATVTATAGSGATQNKQTATYKILFGAIDASVEPRSQKPGGKVAIYVHAKKGVHVRAIAYFPNGSVRRFNQVAGPKGFGHWTYKVGKNLTRGSNNKVIVQADTVGQRTHATTKTFFRITK